MNASENNTNDTGTERILPSPFTLQVTMLSDWHVGSGMGRPGDVDRLVVRDSDELPYIPAKTLRGIWRDACERLARGLDNGTVGGWTKLVDHIFGSQPSLGGENNPDPTGFHFVPSNKPLSSPLKVSSARFSENLRRAMKQDRRLLDALTFIKPGVRIDPKTGSAKEDHLHFDEVARTQSVLEAECTLDIPEDDPSFQHISALLLASTLLVERLGGKRRRGMGKCKLKINEGNVNQALAWLESHTQAPTRVMHEESNEQPLSPLPSTTESGWIRIPLILTLKSPLAASWRTVGNVVESLDFLPGTYLLPHITKTLKKLNVDPCEAIARGDICVLSAYPEIQDKRSRPIPMAFFEQKDQGADHSKKIVNRLKEKDNPNNVLKQFRGNYIESSANPNQPQWRKTPMCVQTHNAVLDQSQRPDSAVGGVYSYKAIAHIEGEEPVKLLSELRIRESLVRTLSDQWWKNLDGKIHLGRSIKDDYGLVELKTRSMEAFQSDAEPKNNELIVWLLSDMILRDEMLRPATTVDELRKELSEELGVELHVRETENGNDPNAPLNTAFRVRRMDSWNSKWGLPRPTLATIQAGSCVIFTVEGEIDVKRLQEIEASGIGERTAEGYGQVCFNDPILNKSEVIMSRFENTNSSPDHCPIGTDQIEYKFAHLIEEEAWKAQINRIVLSFAQNRQNRKEQLGWEIIDNKISKPTMSQLGGLRSVLTFLKKWGDETKAITWLDQLKDNKKRSETWINDSIGKCKTLLGFEKKEEIQDERNQEKIDEEKRECLWKLLEKEINNKRKWPTLNQNDESKLKKELWPYAVRAFFDACIRAHKRDLDRSMEEKEADYGT